MIADGERECPICSRDVSNVMNRPPQDRARRYSLHDNDEPLESGQLSIGYTGFWKRLLAALIDLLIAAILVSGTIIAGEVLHYPPLIQNAILVTLLFYLLLLTPLMVSSGYRASPGKVVLGSVITEINGRSLSFKRAVFRELAKYLSLMTAGIGFVMIGFSEKKQGLHDILALTVVTPRSEAHILMTQAPAYSISSDRMLLFGKVIVGCALLFSVIICGYFAFVLHEDVTANGLAAHSLTLTADTIADTKYPAYSLPLYDSAMNLAPNDTGILVRKVYVLREEGRVNEARSCLDQAMAANPSDTVPVVASGDLMYADAQYQSAIRYYEKALGLNRNDANVWIKKGDAYLAESIIEMQGMREQYKSLTASRPGSPQSVSGISTMDAFRSTESYREAINAYNEAIRIDPMCSVEISGRVLASTQVLVGTYQGILDDLGIDNSTANVVTG